MSYSLRPALFTLLTRFIALCFFMLLCSQLVFAQDSAVEKNLIVESAEIQNSSQLISATEKTTDDDLRNRLTTILTTIGKYEDLSVKVESGVVFIGGIASEQSYSDLAGEISKNIQGVVAVVNNLSIKKKQYLTIEPIQQELQRVWYKSLEILPLIFIGIIIFSLAFLLSSPLSRWLSRPLTLVTDSQLIATVIKKLISLFVILIGLYFFLRLAGLTQFAVAIISGTGMMGLILGFAFRDIAENFMSSLLLSVQRPFRLGDVISVQGHKGLVRKVTARGTTLVDFDGNHIQIPNATIYKNVIHNFSANPKLRAGFSIGIGYDSDILQAQKIISNILTNHQAVLDKPDHQVLIETLGSSTINLQIYFWIDSVQYDKKKVESTMMRLSVIAFTEARISMPDDAREIIFPEGIPVVDSKPTSKEKKKNISDTNHSANNLMIDDEKLEDLSSDVEDIREQAEKSRDPESGENIL